MKEYTNHLLLIAIDEYQDDQIGNLNSCINDSNKFKEILIDKFYFTDENTTEIFGSNATCDNIHNAFEESVSKLTENDNIVIYFSGHGHYNPSIDRGYWIPFDAKLNAPSSYFSNPDLLDYIKKIPAQHIVLISDSCFSRSILTEYKVKNHKNINSLYNMKSRWALTSGQYYVYENNGFSETIVDVLKSAQKDILISDLVQLVKNQFLTNEDQTPQGSPLKDLNHMAGEFIFKVKEIEFSDISEFKVHKDALKILQLYNRHAKFKELFRVEEGNSKNRVGYVIFLEKNDVIKKDFFYLFLYQGIHLTDTFAHIKKNYSQIFTLNNLIVLLPKEKRQKNPELRKKNVTDNLKPLSVFYIDDFIREECSSDFFEETNNSSYLQISNFIIPSIKTVDVENGTLSVENEFENSFKFIYDWFNKRDEPILVIKGSGGIGKTTLAKHISDKFLLNNEKTKVIFIESRIIISKLNSQYENYDNEAINLYSIYEAATPEFNERFSKDIFKWNFDAGNILIVIDGLDEVISNVQKFKIDEFLSSIEKYSDEIKDGKLLITCRSYFWDAHNFSPNLIKSFEILPFNTIQANRFFQISFNNDEKKINKCLEMSREFSFPDNDGIEEFQPYVLDVICLIVGSHKELMIKDKSFNSKILEQNNKRDYILFRICNRERERVNQISVDEQLQFFIHLSVMKRGTIKAANFKQEVYESLNKKISDTNIEAFKGHPLLKKINNNFKFKYDFFIDYFRNIYISSFIKINSEYEHVSQEFINILSENCWYGSETLMDIRDRMSSWDDTDLLKISELIQQILQMEIGAGQLIRKSISGLFSIALTLNHRFYNNNVDENSKLLRILFEPSNSKNQIYGLSIVNFFGGKETVRFDFSDLVIHQCYINNYQNFWKCNFNKSTFFIEPTLLNIEPRDSSSAIIPKGNFVNPNWDDKFSLQFDLEELKSKNIEENIVYILKIFFRVFNVRGKIDKQPLHRLKAKFLTINQSYFDFKKFIKLIESTGFITFLFENDVDKIDVPYEYKTDVAKFVNDGSMTMNIEDVISKLIKITEFQN